MKNNNSITFQWIPSHIGISGNDKTDALANEGSKKDQTTCPITYAAAKNVLKRKAKQDWKERFAKEGNYHLIIKKD